MRHQKFFSINRNAEFSSYKIIEIVNDGIFLNFPQTLFIQYFIIWHLECTKLNLLSSSILSFLLNLSISLLFYLSFQISFPINLQMKINYLTTFNIFPWTWFWTSGWIVLVEYFDLKRKRVEIYFPIISIWVSYQCFLTSLFFWRYKLQY